MPKGYKNILVNQLMNIGDVLMATSAVALLKKAHPNAKVTMMVLPRCAEVVRDNPVVDDVIVFDYKSKQSSLKSMLDMIKEVRARKFDLSISLDFRLRPLLLTVLAGIPTRVSGDGLYKQQPVWVRKLFTKLVPIRGTYLKLHTSELFHMVIRDFSGIEGEERPVMADPTESNQIKVQELVERLPETRYRVALCIRGTHPEKNWPKESFSQLVKYLSQRGNFSFCIIGAPSDWDYAEQLKACTDVPIINLCGETSLTELRLLLEKMHLFITVDTGAMHIAATTDVPIISIFVCTNPLQWGPLSPNAKVFYGREQCGRFGQIVEEYPDAGFVPSLKVCDIADAAMDILSTSK